MRKSIYILFFLLFFSSINLQAQNAASINRDSIFDAIPAYTEHKKTYLELIKTYENTTNAEVKDLQNNLNKLIGKYNPRPNEAYESLKKRMLPKDIELLDLILKEEKSIQNRELTSKEAAQFYYETNIVSIEKKVNLTIEKYCKTHGIDLVFDTKYIHKIVAYCTHKNITKDIIKLLKL